MTQLNRILVVAVVCLLVISGCLGYKNHYLSSEIKKLDEEIYTLNILVSEYESELEKRDEMSFSREEFIYAVKPGDTLTGIISKTYQNEENHISSYYTYDQYFGEILRINNLKNNSELSSNGEITLIRFRPF